MSAKLQYCVYILFSRRDHMLYIGFTTNLKRSLTDHYHGDVASTAHRRRLELIHYQYNRSEADAVRRDSYLKTTHGKRALMLRETFDELRG